MISIHTTAKVVTFILMDAVHQLSISIHTTAKVVTEIQAGSWQWRDYFNPHHREGGDLVLPSIIMPSADFNPHHREGGDSKNAQIS